MALLADAIEGLRNGTADHARSGKDGEPPLWTFVPLAEAKVPPEPATEAVRRNARQILRQFLSSGPGQEEPPEPEHEGELLTAEERRRCRPPAMLAERVAALEERLGGDEREAAVVIVDPPGGGGRETLLELARRRDCAVVEPTAIGRLGTGGSCHAAVRDVPAEMPLVLPALERMFARTPAGLDAMRHLADAVLARRGPTYAVCGSWAWRYLTAAIGMGDVFAAEICPAPMEADRLERWFARAGIAVAQADGVWVIPPDGQEREAETGSRFLAHVAAAAHGSAGIARAIWLDSLRRPGAGEHDREETADAWVLPWLRCILPELAEVSRGELMLLQLVLLHGSVTPELLPAALPAGPVEEAMATRRLRRLGVLELVEGALVVPPRAYPVVRRALHHHGFWLDAR